MDDKMCEDFREASPEFMQILSERNRSKAEGGIKHDDGKPIMALVPWRGIWEVARVMTYGAKKYGEYNWRGGLKYTRLISGAMRHIVQHLGGEDLDAETGISHLAHAVSGILMAIETLMDRPELDDRYKKL